jgi:glucose/arabinose dehydrogenase
MLKRVAILICAALMSVPAAYATQTAQPAQQVQPKAAAQPAAQAQPGTPAKQAPKPAEAKSEPAAAKAAPEPPPLPVNVRIEVSITDQMGANSPARKVVTIIAGDRQNTNVRSLASVPVKSGNSPGTMMRDVTINVDARPTINQKEPNKINLSLGLEYFPKVQGSQEVMEAGMAQFSERLGLVLESGKPMMISQAADPTSDRKITVEVTATILK